MGKQETAASGKNRIRIFGPKTDGTYIVEFPCRWNRPLFRLRTAQTMPYLGQCGAIATDGDMPIDL